jgi:hypothetical protein
MTLRQNIEKDPICQKVHLKTFLSCQSEKKVFESFGRKNGRVMKEGESQISSRKYLYQPILRVSKMASWLDDLAPKY